MKKVLSIFLIIAVITSMALVSTANTSLGQTVASNIFAKDTSGNPLYSNTDKNMFIELIQLFSDVNDATGLADAYKKAFEALVDGQQDRLSNFGGTVNVAYGFANFLKSETNRQQAIDNLEKYLLENDQVKFAEAIDRREDSFRTAMGGDISKVEVGIKNLPKLFKFLRLSKTWNTEIFTYNTATTVMTLNETNAKKAIASANEELQNDITDVNTVVNAMKGMPEYYNKADALDKTKIYTYLKKYGFLKLETPPVNDDDDDDDDTGGGGTGPIVVPTPTVKATPTPSPKPTVKPTTAPTPTPAKGTKPAPVTYEVQTEEKDGVVTGSFTLEKLTAATPAPVGAPVVLSAKTGSKTAKQAVLNIEMPVIKQLNTNKVEEVVVSTDIGDVVVKPAVLMNTLAKAIPAGTAEDIKDISLSLNALTTEEVLTKEMTEQQKAAVAAIPKGAVIYNIDLSYTRQVGNETVTESLTSEDIFEEPVLMQLPYTPKAGEDPNNIVVYYLDADGNLQNIGGVYDEKTGTVRCQLIHFSYYMISVFSMDFPDLDKTHWAYNNIKRLAANQVINGMPDGTFKPAGNVTRAEFVKMATMIMKYQLNPDYKVSFTDVVETDWFANAAKMSTEHGLVKGYPGNKFMPNNNITRQEIVTIIARSLGSKAIPSTFEDLTYKDKDKIADYAKEAVAVCRSSGILADMENFNPTANTTRAEAAVMLYRLFEILLNMK